MGAKPAVFDPAVVSRLAGSMRSLAVLPEMFVYEIYCRDDRRRLSGPGYEYSWNLVMMRSGGFLQRLDGREDFYDATSAFVSRPGQERYAGHPAGPGDVSTGIWLSERLIEDHFDGGARLPAGRITTSPGFDLAHRLLVAACRRGVDGPEAAERAYDLLRRLEPPATVTGPRSPATPAITSFERAVTWASSPVMCPRIKAWVPSVDRSAGAPVPKYDTTSVTSAALVSFWATARPAAATAGSSTEPERAWTSSTRLV